MPMGAVLQGHVIAEQDHLPRAELQSKVKGVEPAISAPANLARLVEDQLVGARPTANFMDVDVAVNGRAILADLQTRP